MKIVCARELSSMTLRVRICSLCILCFCTDSLFRLDKASELWLSSEHLFCYHLSVTGQQWRLVRTYQLMDYLLKYGSMEPFFWIIYINYEDLSGHVSWLSVLLILIQCACSAAFCEYIRNPMSGDTCYIVCNLVLWGWTLMSSCLFDHALRNMNTTIVYASLSMWFVVD